MQNVTRSTDCIRSMKQCQGVELDSGTGRFTKLIQGVTDPAIQCEEFGSTGWNKRASFMVHECRQDKEITASYPHNVREQEEQGQHDGGAIARDDTKSVEWLLNAFHASQRAALNAILEVYGLRPVF